MLATSVLAVGQDAASSAAHEGTTGNLSLANTGYDTHRFATLEGRQIRTSAHVDTDRYTGYAPAGAAMTVTGDGTVVADAGAATSRIPAAGVRLSESLATSHEQRAGEARTLSRHWSAEAGQARNAAVTDATGLMQRYSHDVSTGEAFARGVTESESSQAQQLDSHVEKLSEIAGISKNQAAVLTGQARVGGGWDFIVKAGADGSVMWRGQTIEQDAWNRVKEYDRQHGVTETWSQVADASRRYSTQTGDSEMAGLDESLSANLTRMRSFQERASLSRQESESWSEQAAQVRSDAQAIERELGQPFFAWLSGQKGTDGRAIGAAGAMRIASPQTAEDSEQLREYAAAFIAEKYPAPAGPDPSTVGGAAEYEGAAGELRGAYGRETAAAYGGWSEGVRDRAREAGAPRPGETDLRAMEERVETKTEQIMKGTAREARQTVTGQEKAEGAAGVAAQTNKPFERHATENLPVVGDWLAGQAVRQREERGARRRARRRREGEAAAGREGLGGLLAVTGGAAIPGSVAAQQPFVLLRDGHVQPRAALRRPVDELGVVRHPVTAECGPVAAAEAAPERERQRRDECPRGRREPRGGDGLDVGPGGGPGGGGPCGAERRGGEAGEHEGALARAGPGCRRSVNCSRHVHVLRSYRRNRKRESPGPPGRDPGSREPVPASGPGGQALDPGFSGPSPFARAPLHSASGR